VSKSFRRSPSPDHTASRATLAAIAALGAACATSLRVGAQSAGDDARACAAITDDTDRLDCYDRVFAAGAAATRAPTGPPAAASPAPASPAPAVETRQRSQPRAAVAPAPGPPAAASPAASAPRASVIESPELAPEIVPIVVVAIRQLAGNNLVFTTEGGDVWVQTDGRRNQLPDTPFDAEIRPGAMSSFFLVPKDRARSIRVRRADD
jgi:hypothetical protein